MVNFALVARLSEPTGTTPTHTAMYPSRNGSMPAIQRFGQPTWRRRGFALVDAIVGGILLGMALTAVIGLTGSAISAQVRGEQLQTAAALADERLNLILATGPESYPGVFPIKGQCDPPFEEFSFEVTLSPQGEGNAYLARADIRWSAGGKPQSLGVETMIAPRVGDDPDPDRKPAETQDRAARSGPSTTGSGGGGR